MSQENTPSETPGHVPAATQDHHDYVALLRQKYADVQFLLRHVPPHVRDDIHAGNPDESIKQAKFRLDESEMWSVGTSYGKSKHPDPSMETMEAAAKYSATAVTEAEQIVRTAAAERPPRV